MNIPSTSQPCTVLRGGDGNKVFIPTGLIKPGTIEPYSPSGNYLGYPGTDPAIIVYHVAVHYSPSEFQQRAGEGAVGRRFSQTADSCTPPEFFASYADDEFAESRSACVGGALSGGGSVTFVSRALVLNETTKSPCVAELRRTFLAGTPDGPAALPGPPPARK